MNNMRKLIEAVEQLNEYLVRQGDSFDELLSLNVFEDILANEEEDFLDFHGDRRWQEVVNNYKGIAQQLADQIKKYAAKGRTLTSEEAEYAEETWYDGSDAYNSVEEAVEWLPEIFDRQLEAVEAILDGNIEGEYEEGLEEDEQLNEVNLSERWLYNLIRDVKQLERDTVAVYKEAASEESKRRPDYTEMLLNELEQTIKQIHEIVETYEDAIPEDEY